MHANHPLSSPRARHHGRRDLIHLLVLTLLLGTILVPLPAAAQSQGPRPGATDPAVTYTEWRDDEIFTPKFGAQPADHTFSIYEADANLAAVTEMASANPEQHDALGAAAGRILTTTGESLVYAYRGTSPAGLALGFFDPPAGSYTAPVYTLPNLAARYPGSTDFFDIAAADINGTRAPDGEYREEVAVAYAEPSGDNKLPVQLAVLDFTDASPAAPQPTGLLTITAAAKLDAADLSTTVGKIRPTDNLLAIATGDFDGNYLDEIAVAFLTGTRTAVVETYRYTTTVDAQNHVTPLLARATSTTVNLGWGYYNGSVALVAADFDGNHRDELALGTTGYWTDLDGIRLGDQRVYAMLLRFACNDGKFCTTSPAMTVTAGANTQVFYEGGTDTPLRVQLGAGLFKYDPATGWDIYRQQLVVGHYQVGSLSVRTLAVNTDLTLAGLQSVSMWGEVPFWMAVGSFGGSTSNTNPYSSVALATWTGTTHALHLIKPTTGSNILVKQITTAAPVPTGARQPLVAVDWDGNSMYLGAPIQLTIENLVDTDAIIEEPPKHAYWDPNLKRVVSVSRSDAFSTILSMSTSDQLTSTSKDTSSTAWGSQGSASAYLGWETHGGALFTPKVDISTQLDVSGKVGKDYEDNNSSYNSSYQARTVDSTASTARDDYLKARLQLLDIWRYRVYGADVEEPSDQYLYYDIILPGPYDSLVATGGGLTFPWYQPLHENGNILSYPGLDSLRNPSDLGSYQIPCPSAAEAWDGATPQCAKCNLDKDAACNLWGTKTLKMLWINPEQHAWDGAPETLNFKYSTESGSGAEHSYSEKMTSSQTVKATESVKIKWGNKALGSSVSFGGTQQYDHHYNDSWGYSDSAQAKTSQSTGIQVQKPASDLTKPYAFYTTAYVTDDGTIRVAYGVDLSHTVSDRWWSEFYAPPDLALNLPKHFYYMSNVVTPHWQPRTGDDRKEAHGLLFYGSEKDPVTGEYPLLNGAATDVTPVRIEARVYNYSLLNTVPGGTAVCFDTAPIDPATLKEVKAERARIPNGCTALPADLLPQASVVVSAVWDTTGYAGVVNGTSREYRVYAVLDPNNQVAEKYETETKATQYYWTEDRQMNDGGSWTSCAALSDTDYAAKTCIDPAQNNEGFAYFTVSKQLLSDPRWDQPNHVSLPEDAIAPIDASGQLAAFAPAPVDGTGRPGSDPVGAATLLYAYVGEPVRLRVAVQSTAVNTDYAYAALFDGDPQQGGMLVGVDHVFVGNAEAGSYAWFEWTPTTRGTHHLYAKIFQSVDDPQPGSNTSVLEVEVATLLPGGYQGHAMFLPIVGR